MPKDSLQKHPNILAFSAFKNNVYLAFQSQKQDFIISSRNIENQDLISNLTKLVTPIIKDHPSIDTVITLGGPAPFTTLRILIAAMHGYAMGFNAQKILINSFDLLQHYFNVNTGNIVIETRSGRYFCRNLETHQDTLIPEKPEEPVYGEDDIKDNPSLALISFFKKYPEKNFKEPYYMHTPEYRKFER